MVPIDCAHDPWPGLLEHLESDEDTHSGNICYTVLQEDNYSFVKP